MAQYDVVLEKANKIYPGGTHAVIDFSAEIEHGELVAMLGPSGCGKTTTLRMIGGLEETTSGKIYISGEDVTDLPPSHRNTSMMFQSFALFPHRTVTQNVEFSLKMQGVETRERARKTAEMLEKVDLTVFANRRPHELSGGQQQRVALARALISEPTVLLLDEPLGSLDYSLRQAMMVELKKIQRELEMTFILVTHSQQEAMSLADKVIVMSDAVIQQIGTSREIYESPRTKFVAEFIGNNNLFPGVLKSRSGSMALVESNGSIIYVRMSEGMKTPPIGREVYVSVRADLIHTGEHPDMGNSVQATYVATEFLGSLETDGFEITPGLFVHVEQHRSITDRTYEMGQREVLSWPADAGVILSETGPAGQE